MANIGFHQAMAKAGIKVRTTAVGDRYVLEDMRAGGYSLGGEQSGHLILADHATTGDGLLSALHLMAAVAAVRTAAGGARQGRHQVPAGADQRAGRRQGRRRVVARRARGGGRAEAELGDSGRVLLRPSGTEPLVRVMVEAGTAADAQDDRRAGRRRSSRASDRRSRRSGQGRVELGGLVTRCEGESAP